MFSHVQLVACLQVQVLCVDLVTSPLPPSCTHMYTPICTHMRTHSRVPAFLNVVDIAGLVKGAHEGQGLGNAFLANISACDALFHILSKLSLAVDTTHLCIL